MVRPMRKGTSITADQEEAWFALISMHADITARIDTALMKEFGISFSAFEILCRLLDLEPQPVRSLARQLVSVSPTRASRLMQDLVDAGHLTRGADQADGRVSLISFTPEGRYYAGKVLRVFEHQVLKYFVEPLDPEDIAAVTKIWTKLAASRT